ncbi:subtilisin-like serine protease [Terriglobus roseus DSM 18391]|uniref:Subtilisin-like serine protease n=1 Tax=Terriglobus roseus (strain DSM 18391 / NRRL B-41598 / KBS 63) TaxID=926566 RepID=I3ZHA4_TERRK|nr:S8 family serine peptidase [Terriglobus roseus]AFL88281.1 subtilisin-like serine protease [Terriglobus roseus DSM 18391]AFL88622.1 subtilisin-like serine protease [Terriglobus roseus DSM 18391]
MFSISSLRRAVLYLFFTITTVSLVRPDVHGQTVSATAASVNGVHRLLVIYRNGSIPGDAEGAAVRAGGHLLRRHERLGTALLTGTSAAESALKLDPRVEFVVEDRVVTASSVVTRLETDGSSATRTAPILRANVPRATPRDDGADSFYRDSAQGWAVRAVGAMGGGVAGSGVAGPWATTTGKGVRIAILDSGVDRAHPDIAPNLALSMTEINQAVQPSVCDDGSPQDQSGHGTWVASLAAGAAGSGTGRMVGVAPEAVLLNIKVMQRMPGDGNSTAAQCNAGQASGLLSWVLQGVEDAIAQRADVIVMSMSVTLDLYSGDAAGLKASFDRVTHAAADAGAVVVAAAGNDAFDFTNTRYLALPAQSRDVLAVVASTNPDCAQNLVTNATCVAGVPTLAYYSNLGAPLHAVGAPGGSYPAGGDESVSGWVRGACSNGQPNTVDGVPTDANHSEGCFNLGHVPYVQALGTSASAPLAAGVVALVRAAHPEWSAATVLAAVRASAVPTASMAYGVVNAAAALAYRP